MADHFAAFSFVDRITELEPGRRARGKYAVPADLESFPVCLVSEAIGQLAAWAAMSHIDFRARPVAGLAGETRFHRGIAPGCELDLSVELVRCDDELVAYSGQGSVVGSLVNELVDCLGPMLPVEEFDSPQALSARLELLRGQGAKPGAFRGFVAPRVEPLSEVPGVSARAVLHVPADAPFFGDHFPRKPVFPATLLLEAQLKHAMEVARKASHWRRSTTPRASRMTSVKMRAFMPPGTVLELDATLSPIDDSTASIKMTARMDGKIASTSQLEVVADAKADA